MKNTPEVRRLFEQMSDIAEHLTSGYVEGLKELS